MAGNLLTKLFRPQPQPDEHETHLYTRGCHGSVAECGYEMRSTDAACSGCPARVDRVDSGEDCDYHRQ